MRLYHLLRRESSISFTLLVFMAGLAGLTNALILSIINSAAQATEEESAFLYLIEFMVVILFYIFSQRYILLTTIAEVEKVLHRIRSLRGGQLNDPRFKRRMKGEGIFAEQIEALFSIACRKAEILATRPELSTSAFVRPSSTQLSLFR